MSLNWIPPSLRNLYEVHQWRHACAIMRQDFPEEFDEIIEVIGRFRLPKSALVRRGGNRNPTTSGWIYSEFYKKGWCEKEFDDQDQGG